MKRKRKLQSSPDRADAIAVLDRIAKQVTHAMSWRTAAAMLMERADSESTPPDARNRDLLAAGRIMRDAGAFVDADEEFLFMASPLLALTPSSNDHPELRRLRAEMDAIERAEGLPDDEYWPPGEGPDDYEVLRIKWDRIHKQTIADSFRAYDEAELADQYQRDPKAFYRRLVRCRVKFMGPLSDDLAATLPDEWLND